ncbi:hypothetical protein D3C84_989280 [compost metagenome]
MDEDAVGSLTQLVGKHFAHGYFAVTDDHARFEGATARRAEGDAQALLAGDRIRRFGQCSEARLRSPRHGSRQDFQILAADERVQVGRSQ